MNRKSWSKLWMSTGGVVVVAGLALRADASPSIYIDTHGDQSAGSTTAARDIWSASVDDDGTNLYFTYNLNPAATLDVQNFVYGVGLTTGNPAAGGDTQNNLTTNGNPYQRDIAIDSSLGGMLGWVGLFGAGGNGTAASPFTGYGYNDFVFGAAGSGNPAGVWTQKTNVQSGVPFNKQTNAFTPPGGTKPSSITVSVPIADFASVIPMTPGATVMFDLYSTGTGGGANKAGQTAYDSLADPSPAAPTATTEYNGTVLDSYTMKASPAPLLVVWDNTLGAGDGATWDMGQPGGTTAGGTINQNWKDGSVPFFFFQNNAVLFNDSNNGHYAVTLNTTVRPAAVTLGNSAGNYTISGTGSIAGTGALAKIGTGTATISTANSYTGQTQVGAGTLVAASDTALGSSTAATAGVLFNPVSGTATLAFTSASPAIASLANTGAGSASVVLGNATAGSATVLTVGGNNSSTSFGGVISDLSGTNAAAIGGLTKVGSGTLTLTGANTYTGATTINGGVLKLDANQGGSLSGSSAIALGGGTFALLGQSGAVTTRTLGGLTLNSGSGSGLAVDGGNSTSTTLNIVGPITASAVGTSLDISTATSGATTAVVTTTQLNNNGILSGRITINGTDFAANGPTPGTSPIGAPTHSPVSTAGGTDTNNSLVTDSATLGSGTTTTNSLKITDTQAGQSLQIGAGNTLALTSGGLLFTGASDYMISGGSVKSGFGNPSDLIVHQYGSGTLTVSSIVADGSGASSLTKAGPGTLRLNGNNTYTGNTFINNGTLILAGTNSSSSYGVNAATLSLQAANAINAAPVTLNGTANLTETVANGLSGSASLTLSNGTPTATLSQANTYTGNTTINAGSLQLGNTNAVQNSVVTLAVANGLTFAPGIGTFTLGGLSGSAALPLVDTAAGAVTIQLANANSLTFSGVLSGAGGVTELGPGAETISAGNTYTGLTTVSGGTLNATNNTSLGSNAAATAGLILNPSSGTATVNFTSATPAVASLASSGAGTSFIVLGNAGGTPSATTLSVGGNNASTAFAGSISDVSGIAAVAKGSLTKVGTGSLTLSGANSYTGTTTLNGGTLVAGNTQAFGAPSASIVASPSSTLSGIVTLDLATDSSVAAYGVTEGNSGTLVIQSDKATPSSPGITHALGTLSFGAATLTIAAGPNVSGGSPAVSFGNTTLNSVHNNTTIFNPTTANMNVLGTVVSSALSAQTVTLQLDGTSAGNTIVGAINDNPLGGSTALTKANTSTWTISGASSYTGNTAVNGGTLTIDSNGSIISPAVNVAAGAVLNVIGSLGSQTITTVSGTANFGGNPGSGSFTRSVNSLNIASGGLAKITTSAFAGSPAVLTPSTISFADNTAKLDLTNNEALISDSLANVRTEISGGMIKTSTAGLVVGSLDLGNGQIEARGTYAGDANIDGKVDVGDLGALATNYGISGGMTWVNGDFNYDNNVDVGDLGALATNYGLSLATGPSAGAATSLSMVATPNAAVASSVPEPSSFMVLAIGATGLAARRRKPQVN